MEDRMADAPLDVRVEDGPTGPTIWFSGRIDRDADAAVADAWTVASGLAIPGTSVTLDFGEADYINSTGIALIVRLLAEARGIHLPIRGRGLTAHYLEIFRITRLSDFMTIEDSAAPTGGDTAEAARDE
jgi:anti-anti-sigma regulatory factor